MVTRIITYRNATGASPYISTRTPLPTARETQAATNGSERKMSLHLQPDWQRTLGQDVEIRVCGKPVRTGTIEAVMPDNSILWISADGADSRQMLARADGYEVYTRYPWTYPIPSVPDSV
jgi:hypothetical protein